MNAQANNNDTFVHSGIISKISGDSVIVALEQNIHCESCKAKAACGISESTTKEVTVYNATDPFIVNEHVKVILKKTLGFKAVFWAYVFPFLLMLLTLIIASAFFAEWIAGVLSILVLLPYYLTLHFLKNNLKSAFKISILKQS
ncbi:SoxR reducing system RseC family protein [Flavobacteriaceae bacterium SZ-1-7]|uniref:SoxR reducing system RseC family protein n=1 Tax=Tamlana sedimenti TaxID=3134126 RepID=UPI003127C5A9